MDVDHAVPMAVDAVGVGSALPERNLVATVVDRVGGVPVITDARWRSGLPVGAGHDHQADAEDDHDEDSQRKPEFAALRRTTR